MWPFRKWGPYPELTAPEWEKYLKIFEDHDIKPLVAITASWVEEDSQLTPFPDKFPEEAAVLKKAALQEKITIANHGLTHCIVGKHLPLLRHSNRPFHREFWPELDQKIHTMHVLRSQEILESWLGQPVTDFIPPGNVWSIKTYQALQKTNVKKVIANRYMLDSNQLLVGLEYIDDRENFVVWHDRDLKLNGGRWTKRKLAELNK
jgi:peptidoglycan/xylan/chitin deacetylase (PgdA/CDA1 family)